MPKSLRDQVAVVTGASSGIGLAIARALAAEGARLVLGARSQPKLDAAAAALGEAAIAVRTDVTSTADVDALIGTAIGRHGRIDILIANAGVYTGGDFAAADPAELLALIDTNVGGIVRTVHAALRHMIPAGSGDIVITSSVAGHQVIAWEPVYSASKHAVHALTHGIRRQLTGTGVRIGSIAPGVVLNGRGGGGRRGGNRAAVRGRGRRRAVHADPAQSRQHPGPRRPAGQPGDLSRMLLRD
jgi:ribitol 2-dehydrogenase